MKVSSLNLAPFRLHFGRFDVASCSVLVLSGMFLVEIGRRRVEAGGSRSIGLTSRLFTGLHTRRSGVEGHGTSQNARGKQWGSSAALAN